MMVYATTCPNGDLEAHYILFFVAGGAQRTISHVTILRSEQQFTRNTYADELGSALCETSLLF